MHCVCPGKAKSKIALPGAGALPWPHALVRVHVCARALLKLAGLHFSCEACETCGYPRKSGGAAQTPAEYSKAYGVFVKNLVALRKSRVGYAQLAEELEKNNLAELEAKARETQKVRQPRLVLCALVPCAFPARTPPWVQAGMEGEGKGAVSYTHLTLPTKRIV